MIPRPPALPPPLFAPPPGFRLRDDDTGSVYSAYKQKIDSMFDSDGSNTTLKKKKNTVQVGIEKMFSEVANDAHSFTVDYLGSVPLADKVTSLTGLQGPLKELYFTYKMAAKDKALSGRLEISHLGLKVRYRRDKVDQEQLNPFPTIAVWSAVKFVTDDEPSSFAFVPLIADPDNLDKQTLFTKFQEDERRVARESHAPLFAVVMRKIGAHKQLECHGFVCQTSEDAIVIAATLYRSLMSHMNEKKPKQRNGVTCMSVASSVYERPPTRPPRRKRSTASSSDADLFSDTRPLLGEKKKSTKEKRAPKPPVDLDAIVAVDDKDDKPSFTEKIHTIMSNEQKQITEEIKQMMNTQKGMKSLKRRRQESARKSENAGDILTKVAIPRSGSFLNAQGLTRYKSKVVKKNGQASGGSPLGFNELFAEFRLQEGLHSMDDILGVIIDSEGMSFNDLKPIYKEFLLKLAVTLTKDELYQRSKAIMRRQKKKLMRKTDRKTRRRLLVGGKIKRFALRWRKRKRSKRLVEASDRAPESTISTASFDTRQFVPKKESPKAKKKGRRDRASTSEDSDFVSMRRNKPAIVNGNQNRNSSSGYVSCSDCSYDSDSCTCVSADKCYCSLGNGRRVATNKPRRRCCSAELTFCGCDTDSCAESNKCYCAIRSRRAPRLEHKKSTRSVQSLEYMANPNESYYERPRLRQGRSLGYSSVYNRRPIHYDPSIPLDYDIFRKHGTSVNHVSSLFSEMNINAPVRNSSSLYSVASRNFYNKYKGNSSIPSRTLAYADMIINYRSPDYGMVQNVLYQKGAFPRNSLYTIQSRSDRSIRTKNYYELDCSRNVDRNELEDSLGYLP